jgi:hypothetical protein
MKSPFVPPKSDNFDEKNINEEWKDADDEAFKENHRSLHDKKVQEHFDDYYFDH